jgi:hypothetical protein
MPTGALKNYVKNAKWKVKNGKGTLPNAYCNLQTNTGQNQLQSISGSRIREI